METTITADPYAEAKAAYADGELEWNRTDQGWVDWGMKSEPGWICEPKHYRRKPKQATPWYPPVPEGFGPWVECCNAEIQPIGKDVVCQILCAFERKEQRYTATIGSLAYFGWASRGSDKGQIVAYCVAINHQTEPTQAEVEQTQKPHTPTLDAMEDELAANKPMFDRDAVQPPYKGDGTKDDPAVTLRNPLLVCAPMSARPHVIWGAA